MPQTRRSLFSTFSFAGPAVANLADAGSKAPFLDDICSSDPSQMASQAESSSNGADGEYAGYRAGASTELGADPKAYSRFISEMHTGMDKMNRDMHADPPSGDPDLDFLAMMIPHHWGATEMARLVLLHGRDPLVREIAEKILATQVSEIDGMRGRLAELRESVDSYPSLTGNRG